MNMIKRFGLRVAFGLVIVAAFAIYSVGKSLIAGNDRGETCADSSDCRGNILRFGSQCLDEGNGRAYCTTRCDTKADCESGWECTEVGVEYDGAATPRREHLCTPMAPAPIVLPVATTPTP